VANTLALEHLFAAVSTRFATEGTAAENVFGWRKPAQPGLSNRIVWVPGDPSGNAGATGPARNPGRNPRSLATLYELFTVIVAAVDLTAPDDEAAQYKVARVLRDAWFRAVYLAAHGTFEIKSERWITDKLERRRGAALEIVCAVEAMVPDAAAATAPVDTGAAFDVELGAVLEQSVVGNHEAWVTFATQWDTPPVAVGAATDPTLGSVYAYVLAGVTRYRLVPAAYNSALDAFYSTFAGSTVGGLLVSRGA